MQPVEYGITCKPLFGHILKTDNSTEAMTNLRLLEVVLHNHNRAGRPVANGKLVQPDKAISLDSRQSKDSKTVRQYRHCLTKVYLMQYAESINLNDGTPQIRVASGVQNALIELHLRKSNEAYSQISCRRPTARTDRVANISTMRTKT